MSVAPFLPSALVTQSVADRAATFLARRGVPVGRPLLVRADGAMFAVRFGPEAAAGRIPEDPSSIYVAPGQALDTTLLLHEELHLPGHIVNCAGGRETVPCALEEGSVESVAEDLSPAFDPSDRFGWDWGSYAPQVRYVRLASGVKCAAAGMDPRPADACARAWRIAFVAADAEQRAAMVDGLPPPPTIGAA
jgi:hypothetical protein